MIVCYDGALETPAKVARDGRVVAMARAEMTPNPTLPPESELNWLWHYIVVDTAGRGWLRKALLALKVGQQLTITGQMTIGTDKDHPGKHAYAVLAETITALPSIPETTVDASLGGELTVHDRGKIEIVH